jgi:hypothetical protein
MRATVAMLAAFAVTMAGFLVYSRVIMPQPAELTGVQGPVVDPTDSSGNGAMATVRSVTAVSTVSTVSTGATTGTTTVAPTSSRVSSVQ